MAVHFIHIPKTGGTAIKTLMREAGRPPTPYGRVKLHVHAFTLRDLRPGHHAFFCVRAPIPRFVSGFYSRLRKGQPRYFYEWNDAEAEAFDRFTSPAQLATALADDDPAAIAALENIQHVNAHQHHSIPRRKLQQAADQVLFIARTETLSREWPLLKNATGLPQELVLPTDPVATHRNPFRPEPIDARGKAALRAWFAKDIRLVRYCEQLRHERGMIATPDRSPRALLRRGASAGRSLWRSAASG